MITFPTISNFFSQMYEDAKEHVKERTEYVMDPKQWDLSKSLPYPTDVFIKNKELGSEKVNEALGEALQYVTPGGKLAALAGPIINKAAANTSIKLVHLIDKAKKELGEDADVTNFLGRNKDNIDQARIVSEDVKEYNKLVAGGMQPGEQLYKLTGFYNDPLGNTKYFLPDSWSTPKLSYAEFAEKTRPGFIRSGKSVKNRDVREFPLLYYLTNTGDIPLKSVKDKNEFLMGYYSPSWDEIGINQNAFERLSKNYANYDAKTAKELLDEQFMSTVGHETGHGVQEKLGLPQGAGPDWYEDYFNLPKGHIDAMAGYLRTYGELEQQLTQRFYKKSKEQIRDIYIPDALETIALTHPRISDATLKKVGNRPFNIAEDQQLHDWDPATLMLFRDELPTLEDIIRGYSAYDKFRSMIPKYKP